MVYHPGNRKEGVLGLNISETLTFRSLCRCFCLVLLQHANLDLSAGFHPELKTKLLKPQALTEFLPKITILAQVCSKLKFLL